MSLHRIDQRGQALDPNLEPVAGFDGPNTAGCSSQNHVARKQRHICRNKAHQLEAVENKLARMGVLTQLAILEELNGQLVRVNLRLNVGTQWREGVERLGPRPLAFA